MSEVQRYAVDLRSMTSGRGTFEVAFDHYEEVPHQEAQINVQRVYGVDHATAVVEAAMRDYQALAEADASA